MSAARAFSSRCLRDLAPGIGTIKAPARAPRQLNHCQDGREGRFDWQQIVEFLLDHVADRPFTLSTEPVERVRLVRVVGSPLQGQQPGLRSVAVGDDQLVAGVDRGQRGGCDWHIGALRFRGHRLAATQ